MSALPDSVRRARWRLLLGLAAASLVFLLILLLSGLASGSSLERHPRSGTPVLDRNITAGEIARIDIVLADESYSLFRTPEGWRMDSPEGYPVIAERIGELLAGLEELSWGEARTGDPRKLDRLGLADPSDGGSGSQLIARNAQGEALAELVFGRRDDRLYLRQPGETLAFSAEGDLPGLRTRSGWLDFAVIAIVPAAIEGAVLVGNDDRRLHLTRQPGGGPRDFMLGPRHEDLRITNPLAAATPALALSRFAPLGVKPAGELTTQRVARHITLTQDGLEVITDAYDEPDGNFLTVRAVEAAEGAHRAAAINARAEGWAFEVARYDWADFTAPIDEIVRRVEPETDPETLP